MKRNWKAIGVVSVLLVLVTTSSAIIRPEFPPEVLYRESETVLVLELKVGAKDGKVVGEVKQILKGACEKKQLTIDLEASPLAVAAGGELKGLIARGQKQALLFTGRFENQEAGGGEPGDEEVKGMLHLGGPWNGQNQWFVLSQFEPGVWDMDKIDEYMLGCWNGSTDMLIRCINYIRSTPDAEVPVTGGVEWAGKLSFGKLETTAVDAVAVTLAGAGAKGKVAMPELFLPGGGGDRLYRWDGKTLADVTAKHKLASKSLAHAWGDFDADGRIDLASWDGKALAIHSQTDDGTFAGKTVDTGAALKNGCLALATVDVGQKGRPGLVASTKASPVLLTIQADGSVQCKPLVAKEWPGKELGAPGKCLVADLDGDALADVLQVCEGASLFYKGTGPGAFAPPVLSQVAVRGGSYDACLGDFDADGLPDVFIAAGVRNSLWHNLGAGKFRNLYPVSGEISYHSKSGGISACSGDFNNDGRQDILIAYGEQQMSPHLYFNRGFCSFGQAYEADLNEQRLLPEADAGQQAGCLGDFNGDGALDMVLVLKDGALWFFPREVDDEHALVAVAALPVGGSQAGPVNVTAWRNDRPLGAQVVRAGEPGAFFGTQEAGPIVIKWTMPGAKIQKKEIIVEEGPRGMVIGSK